MLTIEKKIFSSWDEAGINIPTWNTSDKINIRCPKCSDDRKTQNKNKRVLGVNISAKLFNCNHCGYSGKIIDAKNVQKYLRPEPIKKRENDDLLSDNAKAYLLTRGIDIQAALKFGCISIIKRLASEKMGEFEDKEIIVFPYNDAKGDLLFYKYRSLGKEFSGSRSPQYVFWQLDTFKTKKILIVTEGEYDALAWQTAFNRLPNNWSIKCQNVSINDIAITSVPNGISKKQLQGESVIIEYFERCIPFIQHFEQVFLSVDNDEAGLLLQNELARRFGKDICKIIKFPNTTDQKDANGVLLVQGEKALQDLFNNADFLPIEGVYSISDVSENLQKGLGYELQKGNTIGFEIFDEYASFNQKEGLTLITGAPNSAKSDFMFNVMIRLSLRYNWKWLISSPETGDVEEVYRELLIKLIGKTYNKTKFEKVEVMSKDELDWGMAFLKEHIYVMESIELTEYTLDVFILKVEKAVKKYGINAAVIDPYNAFENAFDGGNMSNKLNRDLTLLQTSKRKLGINYFVIAHPKSLISTNMTNPYDVNGGAAWYNKVDFFFMLNRGEKTVFTDGRGDDIEVKIAKVKKRHLGKRGEAQFAYHIPTGRFGEIGVVFNDKLFEDYNDILGTLKTEQEQDIDPFDVPILIKPISEQRPDTNNLDENYFEQLF